MAKSSSSKAKAIKLCNIIENFNEFNQDSASKIMQKPEKIKYLEAVIEKSVKNQKTSFNKTRTFKEGKLKISMKREKKSGDLKEKAELLGKLFSSSSSNKFGMINPELMLDKEVQKYLKTHKRSFGGQDVPFPKKFESLKPVHKQNSLKKNYLKPVMTPKISYKSIPEKAKLNYLSSKPSPLASPILSHSTTIKTYEKQFNIKVSQIKLKFKKHLNFN